MGNTLHLPFQLSKHPAIKQYQYEDLRKATNNFSIDRLVALRAYSSIFLGTYKEMKFAVRRLDRVSPDPMRTIRHLSVVHHENLAELRGYCFHGTTLFLVHEFVWHGSLDRFLYHRQSSFSWARRLRIALGVARGLHHLHSHHKIIYGNFKTSSILLDEDYNAKLPVGDVLADFCPVSPYPLAFLDPYYFVDDAGYSAPELHFYGILSPKSDVYSFGVVLLELLTKCKAKDIPRNATTNLVSWAKLNFDHPDKIIPLLDDGIKYEHPSFGPILVAYIAKWCLQDEPYSRPSMMDIILLLEKILSLSQMSRK